VTRTSAAVAALGTLLAAAPVHAAVSLSTEVSARKVEAGDRFMVRLRINSDAGEQVTSPELKLPPGVTGSGPNVSSQSSFSLNMNGQMSQSVGLSVTWALVAATPGKYKIGPASVMTPDGRESDRAVTVEVVPPGTLPTPPLAGQPMDPFNMLRGMGGLGFPGFPPGFPGMDDAPQEPQLPQLPEEFRIEKPLDPLAFVRMRAVPRRVVVGEQVTLSGYAYAGRGEMRLGTITEPSRDDFLAFNLMDDGQQPTGYQFDWNGQRWLTAKIAEFALFPLKSGKLKAGEMSVGFVGRAYSQDPQGLQRKSTPVEIEVVEPPLEGRPPGYKLGDVGHYDLSVNVSPREIPAGGSISIVAKLEGTGNVPFSLLVPEQDGVHFLEPQIVDQVGPKRGVVQGFRTFTYVVELSQEGERDLGEITLPYYDPKAKAYGVARAALGTVKVTPGVKPPAGAAPAAGAPGSSPARLKGLVIPPSELGSVHTASPRYWPSRSGYWLLLFGLPLGTVLGFALSDLAKLLARRAGEKRGSLATALAEAQRQLAEVAPSGNIAATASAAERVLFLAIELGTGLKGRGVLKAQLAQTLGEAGVPAELATRTAELLGRCDELRFAGEAADLPLFVSEVADASKRLSQLKPQGKAGAGS
jgi:hypothetical protein